MIEIPEITSLEQVTPQELTEMLAELEEYRERLVNETLTMAQRAKIMKAQALSTLEPSLNKIDTVIETLRQQQSTLSHSN